MPPIDDCLRALDGRESVHGLSRGYLKTVVQTIVDRLRQELLGSNNQAADRGELLAEILRRVEHAIANDRPVLQPLVNATGVVLHTNLGRALLAETAIESVYPTCRCICHMRPMEDPSIAWSRLGEAERRLLFGPGPWPDRSKEIL